MTTINISRPTSKGSPASLDMPSFATASFGESSVARTPFFVPRAQAYYWTTAWQRDESAAMVEIAGGDLRTFTSGKDAALWLLSDDDV